MFVKKLETDFGKFTFLDEYIVVAEAYSGVNIDASKVSRAIALIENEINGDYAMILDRKSDYSVVPIEVYNYFASVKRLKMIAIVSYRSPDFLPNNMENRIYKGRMEKFASIGEAHSRIKKCLADLTPENLVTTPNDTKECV